MCVVNVCCICVLYSCIVHVRLKCWLVIRDAELSRAP